MKKIFNIQFFAEGEEEKKPNEVETNYIDTIKKLKENSVSKDEYNEVIKQNKELLDAIIDGKGIDLPGYEKEKPDIKAMRDELFGPNRKDMSNYEFMKKVLKFRSALMDSGEKDPFLPYGRHIVPTAQDQEGVDRFVSTVQDCLDYADEAGTDKEGVFTNELMRRTYDANPQAGMR